MIKEKIKNNELLNFIKKMKEKNKLLSILDFEIIDNDIIYNIENKKSLSLLFDKKIESKDFLKILNKIIENIKKLENYMVCEKMLDLKLENIYYENNKIYFKLNQNENGNLKYFYQNTIMTNNIFIDENAKQLIELNNIFNKDEYNKKDILDYLASKEYNENTSPKIIKNKSDKDFNFIKYLFNNRKNTNRVENSDIEKILFKK